VRKGAIVKRGWTTMICAKPLRRAMKQSGVRWIMNLATGSTRRPSEEHGAFGQKRR